MPMKSSSPITIATMRPILDDWQAADAVSAHEPDRGSSVVVSGGIVTRSERMMLATVVMPGGGWLPPGLDPAPALC